MRGILLGMHKAGRSRWRLHVFARDVGWTQIVPDALPLSVSTLTPAWGAWRRAGFVAFVRTDGRFDVVKHPAGAPHYALDDAAFQRVRDAFAHGQLQ